MCKLMILYSYIYLSSDVMSFLKTCYENYPFFDFYFNFQKVHAILVYGVHVLQWEEKKEY